MNLARMVQDRLTTSIPVRGCTTIVGLLLCLIGPVEGCACDSPALPPAAQESPPSAPAPAPIPAPTRDAAVPADLLDLDDWYLTLPTGSKGAPDTVRQPDLGTYQSSYFRLNDARDGVVFTTPPNGVTTKNSAYPRSELREMSGDKMAGWSNTSGTHTLTSRQAVTALPKAKPELVTAQIHDASDDVMEVRLEGEHLMAQYADGKSEITIDPHYRLGTVFDIKIVAAKSRVEVFYNGVSKAVIKQGGTGWYFKSGSYLQSNTSKGDSPKAVGSVVLYSLEVTHSR